MYQIDSSGSVTTPPAPAAAGTPGFWTGGNPAVGQPATVIDADWLNAVQIELTSIVEAAGLTLDKDTNNQVLQAIQALVGSGRWMRRVIYASGGTFTETPPVGATLAVYDINGAGGGGGGAQGTGAAQIAAGGGAGTGGRAIKRVSAPTIETVTVGAAGVGGNSTTNGTVGGTSSVGALASATGGLGGLVGTAASGGTSPGALGGTATGGDLNIPGMNGFGPFGIASANLVKSGMGASSPYGAGGLEQSTYATGGSASGNAAGGAGGCCPPNNPGGASGGPGTPGIVIIDYFS